MRNGDYTQLSPASVASRLPEAQALLHEARIDRTSRLRLQDAALAAGLNVDELLANLEDRARRNARRAAAAAQPVELERAVGELHEEFMLV